MAGQACDSDPTPTQHQVSTTTELDFDQDNGTNCTQEWPFHDSLQEEITPATALDFGLDLDFLDDYPDLNIDVDLIDWGSCYHPTIDDNAPLAFQEPNNVDSEDPEEIFLKQEFAASPAQPESDNLSGFLYDLNDEVAPVTAENLDPAYPENVDSADLLVHASGDFTDLFGISDAPGCDPNGYLPANFELPDIPSGLDFLESLHLFGKQSRPETSASRVALVGSSEANSKSGNRALLIDRRRLLQSHQRFSAQIQPDVSQIRRNRRYIENSAYTPLYQAPESWDIFEYTKDGELDPSRLFSAEEINRFLFTHPLHQGHRNLKESQLRLRVHKTPASSAKRFPNGLFCRFRDCPMRTINQGHLLILVDELSVQYPDHDLYLNAAYFHLFCIERHCNFPEICANLNVSAKGCEARKEDKRKNRFLLTLSEEERIVEDFVKACCANARRGGNPWVAQCPDQQMNGCPHYEPENLPYKGTLCHQLTVTKLHYGGQGRINLRIGREEKAGYEGANIIRHLGDLSKEAALRDFSRTHRNQNQLKVNPKTARIYRGDELNYEEQPDYGYHGTKRTRCERDNGQILDNGIVQAHKRPRLKMPIWNLNPSKRFGLKTERFEDSMVGTPGASPRTVLIPTSQPTRLELQARAARQPQDGRSAPIYGSWSTTSDDESEGEIELAILEAQRRRRALELEDAKEREKECKLRKFKLQKAHQKKRAREDGDEVDDMGKRQRI